MPCFIFVPNFVKLSQTVSKYTKYIKGNDFYTENYKLKGNDSAKNDGGATVVNLCKLSGHASYLCQVPSNYLERYQSYTADTISIRKITKGNNSAKNVGGVTLVNLCTSSCHAIYFYQVL